MIQSMTAPIVERHKKSNSLVGFDPLLISSDSNINNLSLQISSSSLSISPLTAAAPLMMTMEANKDLESELRKLARLFDLTIPSPNKEDEKLDLSNHGSKKSKSLWRSSKRGHRRAKSENNSSGKLNVFKEIMQNSSERRIPMDKKSSRNRDKTPPGSPNPADVARPVMAVSMPNSPMIQDLYKVVTASPEFSLSIPCLSKPAPTSFLTGREVVRTSEQEPSLFQMEIPEASEFLVSVRLSQFVEEYRKIDFNLDLGVSLVGLRRLDMQTFLTLNTRPPPPLTDVHKPVVESLLEAADDVTVQAYFASGKETTTTTSDSRREAVVFERQRQFVVVFRGTTPEQQAKATPIFKNKKAGGVPLTPLDVGSDNDNDNVVQVYGCVKSSYMDLEPRVFACLDRLTEQNPFCDVVFAGHSFGGAMATLAAYRFATARSMVRVSCYTFGAPKIGQQSFRRSANSLPNLKIMRVEYGIDPKCSQPSDGSHVGHSLVIQSVHGGQQQSNATSTAATATASKSSYMVAAYKFEDNADATKRSKSHHHFAKKPQFLKKERDTALYVSALEAFDTKRLPWARAYVGEDVGAGVLGKDNEARRYV